MAIRKSKLYYLVTPSLSSFVACLLISIGLMLLFGFSYQAGKGAIYDYLFGAGSTAEQISSSKSTLSALNDTILGNTTLNKILYFAFWMAIGLVVYIILYVILRGTGEAAENFKEAGYANIKRERLLEDFAIRWAVRTVAIFGWVVFTIIFFKIMWPFSTLAARTASNNFLSTTGITYSFLGLIVLILSLHLEVILARFMMLRVRLFNQQEIND